MTTGTGHPWLAACPADSGNRGIACIGGACKGNLTARDIDGATFREPARAAFSAVAGVATEAAVASRATAGAITAGGMTDEAARVRAGATLAAVAAVPSEAALTSGYADSC